MDVVINSDCVAIPENSTPLITQENVFLNFLVCLGYDPSNPPAADLLRRVNKLEGDWVILSPIRWQASHNDAFIVATGKELELNDTQSQAAFELFSDFLAVDGMTAFYHNAHLWLLHVKNRPVIKSKPVHQLLNQSLMPELAGLDPSLYWQKFITESQMFFASLSNDPLINGVWLWSSSPLYEPNTQSICTDEHFIDTAKICSTQVTLYNPSVSLKEFDILLVDDLEILSEPHKKQLNTIPANWYWNNSAYTVSNSNCFTRFWRTLFHAH